MRISTLCDCLRYSVIASLLAMAACSPKEITPDDRLDVYPPIFPDYVDVTVPPNLVPPRFWIPDSCGIDKAQAVFAAADRKVVVNAAGRCLSIDRDRWRDLTTASDSVKVTVAVNRDGRWCAYKPFVIVAANEPIDPYVAYRLIEPGYESWGEMGIYYRNLEDYSEKAAITNKDTNYGCMNCHSLCRQNPDTMLLHLRADYAGTYFVEGGKVRKAPLEKIPGVTTLVYPSWHPSGQYVAFSTNKTKQLFHTTDANRIEVFDYASDVVVYDVARNDTLSCPYLASTTSLETFPAFSPDGRRLYFCTADSVAMPDDYKKMLYSVCAIDFDPATRSFGTVVDTIYNARADGRSASFPRVSPDGRHLMFTLASYGTFSIWHRDADLYMADLESGVTAPLDILNSPETESYHSWSSNGRWVVFSTRRLDGLYTRLMLAYIDENGQPRKPLLLPVEREDYYTMLMKSYNVPEFSKAPLPDIKVK